MPATSFNVNGVNVYSDKKWTNINGPGVTFEDGSYANVKTGEIVNNGPGYISIGHEPKNPKSGETKTIEKSFQGLELELNKLNAIIDIKPYDGTDIKVVAKGFASIIDNLLWSHRDGRVTISSKDSDSGNTTIFGKNSFFGNIFSGDVVRGNIITGNKIMMGHSNVIMSNSIVSSGSKSAGLSLDIQVPLGCSVDIIKVDGHVSIGDTLGRLLVKIKGRCMVKAGKIAMIKADINGSGELDVESIDHCHKFAANDATLKIDGSGDIRIKGGNINELNATISGSGNIKIGAVVQSADLNISGSGDIRVKQVVNKPYKNKSGSGSIKVGNW